MKKIYILSTIIILLLVFSGCASSPSNPESETPSESINTEPVRGWAADGKIDDGEYSGSNSYGIYSIYWRSDGQYLYIGMTAATEGWVAVAVQPGSRMKDADMIFGFVENGNAVVHDMFSTGAFGPHSPDTEFGGTDDILESAGSEANGRTTIEFKRELDTGDDYDHPVTEGTNQILWAYGANDSDTLKHSQKGYGEIAP